MLPFLRSDLAQLVAYTPHPGGADGVVESTPAGPIDRLDTNESPYDLPDELKQKLGYLLQQLESNRYPDGKHELLKAAIAEYVNESANLSAHSVSADQISIGNGSDELIRSLLIATCLGGAGAILVAQPTFSMYAIMATTLGIPIVTVERSPIDFEIDLEAAQTAIKQTQTPVRAVFVVHPNSPTGNPLTPAELAWLRTLPAQILVVIDEAYFEFSGATIADELPQHPNWVVLRTFSKAFRIAAHRVGYAIAHPELTAALEKVRLPYNLPSFSQAAALLAMAQRRSLLCTVPEILSEREQLSRAIATFPQLQVWPSAANFLFVRLKAAADSKASDKVSSDSDQSSDVALAHLFQHLKAQGTLVRQLSGGLRITVGSPAENQRTIAHLEAALTTLKLSS